MGFSTVPTRENGQTIIASWFNLLKTAGQSTENAIGNAIVIKWFDGPSGTPVQSSVFDMLCRSFKQGEDQTLYGTLFVPATYNAGQQILLHNLAGAENAGNTILLRTVSTLIRPEIDMAFDTTNQHTSTNTEYTLAQASTMYTIYCDLTDSSGQINGISVSAGDIVKIALSRGTDTETADLRYLEAASHIEIE